MPLDVLVTTDRITNDPAGRSFIQHLQSSNRRLNLDDAALYYDFPNYSDYETVTHKPDALVVSRRHGILAIRFFDSALVSRERLDVSAVDESLTQFCSILIGRLLKSKPLRRGMAELIFHVTPVIYFISPVPAGKQFHPESKVVHSLEGFDRLLGEVASDQISEGAFAETRSVLEGAKALNRPKPRTIEHPTVQIPAVALAQLESDIANFDQRQRRAALVDVGGPQRIRGLAGSGKTVILAMKAAHLHLTRPDENILVTFYTRSLRAALKSLITRFYRNYRDDDPNWNKIHIRHGWGGSSTPGVYADACRRHNVAPLSLQGAQRGAANTGLQPGSFASVAPFDYACRNLLDRVAITPSYDHILIDEGQDFPSGFYELCFRLAEGTRDKKSICWAYDELQNILDIKMRTPEELFGSDTDGQPRISLTRSARSLPPGAQNDTILSKCYRNQREVLVTAHAVGFGVYGTIVQSLESREHWEDVGYEVLTDGQLEVGRRVQIRRPSENNPLSISEVPEYALIECFVAKTITEEFSWVTREVLHFLRGGLQPEDIIVIALDDRNAKHYFRNISTALGSEGISTNNIIADPYDEPAFTIPGRVTLSTVYRAKGNEAAVVIAVGVDAVQIKTRLGRNKLFTAFTRTKAWLRVSGVASPANSAGQICAEISEALKRFPNIEFTMPDLSQIETIQRDLGVRAIKAARIKKEYIRKLRDAGLNEEDATDFLGFEDKDGEA